MNDPENDQIKFIIYPAAIVLLSIVVGLSWLLFKLFGVV